MHLAVNHFVPIFNNEIEQLSYLHWHGLTHRRITMNQRGLIGESHDLVLTIEMLIGTGSARNWMTVMSSDSLSQCLD